MTAREPPSVCAFMYIKVHIFYALTLLQGLLSVVSKKKKILNYLTEHRCQNNHWSHVRGQVHKSSMPGNPCLHKLCYSSCYRLSTFNIFTNSSFDVLFFTACVLALPTKKILTCRNKPTKYRKVTASKEILVKAGGLQKSNHKLMSWQHMTYMHDPTVDWLR